VPDGASAGDPKGLAPGLSMATAHFSSKPQRLRSEVVGRTRQERSDRASGASPIKTPRLTA